MSTTHQSDERALSVGWLIVGAIGGLAAAAYGLLERPQNLLPLPDTAVASVNGTPLTSAQLNAALQSALPRDQIATDEQRAQMVSQLIDEELLVQRGVDLGMPTTEPSVRAAIVQSMVASVTAEADAADPSDDELRQFLTAHPDRYTYSNALRVDAWIADEEAAARQLVAKLRQTDSVEVDDSTRRVPGLPETAVPLQRLRMFIGPAIAAAAAEMPAGSSAVFARQGRWYVIRVLEHVDAQLADLEAVRSQVLLDYRRAAADQRLADYLERLRSDADVRLAEQR